MSRTTSRLVFAAAALLLGLGVLTAAVVAMREPFALNDYTAIWGLKARALYRSGSLAALFRVDPDGAFSHPEYPPVWPLLLTVATRARLPYDDLVVTPLWPALTLSASLLAVLAARSARVAAPFALLAGAAVSLLPYWRRSPGYAEGLLVVFVLGALTQIRRFDEEPWAGVRIAIFLTLAAWTKPEGLVAALAAAAVLVFARRTRAALLVALSAVLFAAAPWALVVSRLAPKRPPTDFALSSFSVANLAGALRALASEAAPHAGWAAAAALLLALAPATRRALTAGPRVVRPLRRGAHRLLCVHAALTRVARALVLGPPARRAGRGHTGCPGGGRGGDLRSDRRTRRRMNSRRLPGIAVLGLLLALALVLSLADARRDSAIADEPLHVVAGVTQVQSGTWLVNVEHPPLAKQLFGVGAVWAGAAEKPELSYRDLFRGTRAYLFQRREGRPLDGVLLGARLAAIALFLALLSAAFWASGGGPTGLMAVTLLLGDTALFPHGHFATTDIPVTLFFVLVVGALARLVEARSGRHSLMLALGLALAMTLALATKYSGILVLFLVPGVLLVAALRETEKSRRLRSLALAAAVPLLSVFFLAGLLRLYMLNDRPGSLDVLARLYGRACRP